MMKKRVNVVASSSLQFFSTVTSSMLDCVGRNVDFGVFVIIRIIIDKNPFSPTI